jgi:hypothetical protein
MRAQIKIILLAAATCGVLAGKAEAFHLLPLPHHLGGFHALGRFPGPVPHLGRGAFDGLHRGVPGLGQNRLADFPRARGGRYGSRAYGQGPDRGRGYARYGRQAGYPGAYGSSGYPATSGGSGYGNAYDSSDGSRADCYDAYGRRVSYGCY